MIFNEFISRFPDARKTANGWLAQCPGHEDRRASLSISQGDDGRILLHCFAGCETKDIASKIGFTIKDLMPSTNGNGHKKSNNKLNIIATYRYVDADGKLLYEVCRLEPKDFRQRATKPGGGWNWKMNGIDRVPYHLDRIVKANPEQTIYIPEGEKDVDNLWLKSAYSESGRIIATCNAGGAGKWDAAWSKYFAGRSVSILPDNDKPGRDHAQDVAAKLHGTAASIKIIELPGLPDKGDVSDWLDAGHSVDELQAVVDTTAIVTAEQIAEWTAKKSDKTNDESDEDPGKVKTLADVICMEDHFAQDGGGKLYHYHGGVFRPDAEKRIKAKVKALLTLWGDTKAWSTRLANEVVEFIRVDALELPDWPRLDLVNVENGMVRIADGVLLPHDPKYLSVVQLPVKHDPAATCPHIEAFVSSTFPNDAYDLAWEIPGYLMTARTWLQKAILLLGEGCNGKSVWLSLLTRFIGRHNISAIPLHKLEADKFSVSRLVGKLANICADLPSEHLAGTSTFKALTGGDTLTAEYKFKNSFDLEPFARLVFSANHPPRSADSSAAFFRRWIVIPFDHTFGPDEQIPRNILDARLQSPQELSGMLNKALDGLLRVEQQRRLSEAPSIQEAWRDFHSTTDPLSVWLDKYTIDDPDASVTMQVLRVTYNAAVEREGRPTMTAKAFGQALRKLRPNIEEKQRTVAKKTQWCYVGIGLRDQDHDSLDSRDSRGSPLSCTHAHEKKDRDVKGYSKEHPNRENPVNPVNPVDCFHDWIDEDMGRNQVRVVCKLCGKFQGYKKKT